MPDRITMGNDESILYIRKNYDCDVADPQLGRRIWTWLRENAAGEQVSEQRAGLWGSTIASPHRSSSPPSVVVTGSRADPGPPIRVS